MNFIKPQTIITLLFVMLFTLTIHAKTITFTGSQTGAALKSAIEALIQDPGTVEGDIILFPNADYDFGNQQLIIQKGVSLQGVEPINYVTRNAAIRGAFDITTTFSNIRIIQVRSNNVRLRHLKIIAVETGGFDILLRINVPAFLANGFDQYTGLKFENLILEKSDVQIWGGNGATGISPTDYLLQNVTFDDYTNKGFMTNRSGKLKSYPRINITRCTFKPRIPATFGLRGISLDAGNTEFPYPWDYGGCEITDCLFDGTGIATSRCMNIVIKNNTFNSVPNSTVEMIHLEEFSKNILIEDNIFDFKDFAKNNNDGHGFNLDRNAQPSTDITVQNNVFKGRYRFIISAYSPRNLKFINNNFDDSQINAGNNSIVLDFFEEIFSSNFLLYELSTLGEEFSNNSGLGDNSRHKAIKIRKYPTENANVSPDLLDQVALTSTPVPVGILETGNHYRIVNKTGGYLLGLDSGDVTVALNVQSDNSDLWEVTFVRGYFYTFKNAKTEKYLEVDKGYTESDIFNNRPLDQFPYASDAYLSADGFDDETRPFWALRQLGSDIGTIFYEVCPGGNEKASRISKNASSDAHLELGKEEPPTPGQLIPIAPDDEDLWNFEKETSLSIKDITSNPTLKPPYPTVTKDFINLPSVSGKWSLHSIQGRLLQDKINEGSKVDMRYLANGMYLLKNNTTVWKVIKE